MLFAHYSYQLSQSTCAGALSTTDSVLRLFLVILQVLLASVLLVLNVENLRGFHQPKMKKYQVEMMKKGVEIGCRGKAGGSRGS